MWSFRYCCVINIVKTELKCEATHLNDQEAKRICIISNIKRKLRVYCEFYLAESLSTSPYTGTILSRSYVLLRKKGCFRLNFWTLTEWSISCEYKKQNCFVRLNFWTLTDNLSVLNWTKPGVTRAAKWACEGKTGSGQTIEGVKHDFIVPSAHLGGIIWQLPNCAVGVLNCKANPMMTP